MNGKQKKFTATQLGNWNANRVKVEGVRDMLSMDVKMSIRRNKFAVLSKKFVATSERRNRLAAVDSCIVDSDFEAPWLEVAT